MPPTQGEITASTTVCENPAEITIQPIPAKRYTSPPSPLLSDSSGNYLVYSTSAASRLA